MSKKRDEINEYKEELKGLTYSELNTTTIKISYALMATNPISWKKELSVNRKHAACLELMGEL